MAIRPAFKRPSTNRKLNCSHQCVTARSGAPPPLAHVTSQPRPGARVTVTVASLPRALRGRETRETSYLLASGCRSLVTISLMSISAAISDAA